MNSSGSSGRPTSAHVATPNDDVAQELMGKIQTLMIENEELKLKNSVLQNTVEALSTMDNHGTKSDTDDTSQSVSRQTKNSPNGSNSTDSPESTTEWH